MAGRSMAMRHSAVSRRTAVVLMILMMHYSGTEIQEAVPNSLRLCILPH